MTPDLEQARLDDALRAPLMIGVLVAVELAGLSIPELAEPSVSFRLTTSAQHNVNPFSTEFEHAEAWLLSQAERVRASAEAAIAYPGTAWWWAPVDPARQVWSETMPEPGPPAPVQVLRPVETATEEPRILRWESYAHRSAHAIRTSTREFGGETSYAVATRMMVSGIPGPSAETRQFTMPVRPGFRVYEIHGPADWHRLATTYGKPVDLRQTGLQHVPTRTVPDWRRVGADWDGVHLSLGGLLLTNEVSYETNLGLTRFWAWESEQTQWTGWVFDHPVALPNAFPGSGPPGIDDGFAIDMPIDPAFGSRPGESARFRVGKPVEIWPDQ